MSKAKMVNKKTWEEFKKSGLLWWVNMNLHLFGWAICFQYKDNKLIDVCPARVKYRGFDLKSNDEGYRKISKYLKENADQLETESLE